MLQRSNRVALRVKRTRTGYAVLINAAGALVIAGKAESSADCQLVWRAQSIDSGLRAGRRSTRWSASPRPMPPATTGELRPMSDIRGENRGLQAADEIAMS